MPIHPGTVEPLAERIHDLYADAEAQLLGIVARRLADGYDAPGWVEKKLADVQALRRAAQSVVDELGKATELEVFDVVAEAYNAGARAGLAELGALADEDARRIAESTPNARAVDRLAHETVERVTETHRGILRGVEDGYRRVIAEVAGKPLLGVDTRRQATQQAMQRFADRGLRTFVDRSGRAWGMTSYAEMAVRTAVGRAAVEAHGDRLRAAGVGLVIVSNTPHECPLCRAYEGKVLALDGPDGARTIEPEHATEDDRTVRVHVTASLDEARRAGFQHPNCRHSLAAYLPGVTRTPAEHSADPESYEATQKQRAIERGIRKWKNRKAAAVTPEGKRSAESKVRAWQKKQRQHLAEHPELIRKRYREQPGASNLPSTSPGPPADAVEAARVRAGDRHTLAEMSDDQLGAAMRPGALDDRDRGRIAAEFDRRYPPALTPAARGADTVEGQLADRATLDDALAPAPGPDGWGHLALDDDRAGLSATERWLADREYDAQAQRTSYTRAQIREMYREHITAQWLAAEDACRGVLLSREAEAAGIDPMTLFTGPAHVAYARASEELRRWWADHPRTTLAEYTEQVTGERSAAAETARRSRHDRDNRL
ncbi:phage capsid protein [Streptomyces sp. NHF165]|uniref:phage minor capsid protein n=1 Tax=Streptomyces sp. NHF165 TaxID=2175864 RepID=UPI00132F30B1|nr:phage minor capsid protein [Streptomyces sp. NHF165]QHF97923.1 phage capsid protein [Streptomyces sp. NHF165]